MLEVKNLNFTYPGALAPVLKDISFHIGPGRLCGLFGPNGCGKSTLFKCCLNLLIARQGEIRILGRPVKTFGTRELAKSVAYVPQEHAPPFPFQVKEVVLMGRTPHLNGFFRPGRKDRNKAEEAMARLGISHLADIPYNTLSGGQRQIVLMARAVAQEPRMMFLDEPTSALDFSNQMDLWKTMKRITAKGITIFACTHDPNHIVWFCDRVVVVKEGKIMESGPPGRIMTQTALDTIYNRACEVRHLGRIPVVLPSRLNGFFSSPHHINPQFGEKENEQRHA